MALLRLKLTGCVASSTSPGARDAPDWPSSGCSCTPCHPMRAAVSITCVCAPSIALTSGLSRRAAIHSRRRSVPCCTWGGPAGQSTSIYSLFGSRAVSRCAFLRSVCWPVCSTQHSQAMQPRPNNAAPPSCRRAYAAVATCARSINTDPQAPRPLPRAPPRSAAAAPAAPACSPGWTAPPCRRWPLAPLPCPWEQPRGGTQGRARGRASRRPRPAAPLPPAQSRARGCALLAGPCCPQTHPAVVFWGVREEGMGRERRGALGSSIPRVPCMKPPLPMRWVAMCSYFCTCDSPHVT